MSKHYHLPTRTITPSPEYILDIRSPKVETENKFRSSGTVPIAKHSVNSQGFIPIHINNTKISKLSQSLPNTQEDQKVKSIRDLHYETVTTSDKMATFGHQVTDIVNKINVRNSAENYGTAFGVVRNKHGETNVVQTDVSDNEEENNERKKLTARNLEKYNATGTYVTSVLEEKLEKFKNSRSRTQEIAYPVEKRTVTAGTATGHVRGGISSGYAQASSSQNVTVTSGLTHQNFSNSTVTTRQDEYHSGFNTQSGAQCRGGKTITAACGTTYELCDEQDQLACATGCDRERSLTPVPCKGSSDLLNITQTCTRGQVSGNSCVTTIPVTKAEKYCQNVTEEKSVWKREDVECQENQIHQVKVQCGQRVEIKGERVVEGWKNVEHKRYVMEKKMVPEKRVVKKLVCVPVKKTVEVETTFGVGINILQNAWKFFEGFEIFLGIFFKIDPFY